MSPSLLLAFAWGGVAATLLGGVVLLAQIERQQRLAARIRAVQAGPGHTARSLSERQGSSVSAAQVVAELGGLVTRSGLLSARTREDLEATLATAGFRGSNALALLVGSKLLLLVGLPLTVLALLHSLQMRPAVLHLLVSASAVAGLLAPDFAISRMRRAHLQALDRGLPDALDMMVICANAGLGLEPAIGRVAQEIRYAHPAIAEELFQTATELQMHADSRIGLANLGIRTGLPGLKRLGATLVQTMQYGTAVTEALQMLSAEMRHEMLTRCEERAARLPVLLTMPMILFILPCIFLVVGGPAAIKVMAILRP